MASHKTDFGVIALAALLLFIIWFAFLRAPELSRDDARTISEQAIADAGLARIGDIRNATASMFNNCAPIQAGPENRERSCDDLCGSHVCVLAGVRFDSSGKTLFQPVACSTRTSESIFCHCCG